MTDYNVHDIHGVNAFKYLKTCTYANFALRIRHYYVVYKDYIYFTIFPNSNGCIIIII